MTFDDEPRSGKRDRLARMTRVIQLLNAHPEGIAPAEIARRIDVSVRTVYRDLKAIEGELGLPVWSDGGGGAWNGGVPAAAQVHPGRGDGGRPVGAADGPLRRQVRPGPRGRVREARRGAAAGPRRARRPDPRRDRAAAAGRGVQPPCPPADTSLGRAPRRRSSTTSPRRTASVRRPPGARPASGRTSSSRRSRPTRCTSSGSTRPATRRGRSRSSGSGTWPSPPTRSSRRRTT